MSWLSAFAIYFIIWWVTLFVVLPFGVRSQAEADSIVEGTDPGAPIKSRFGLKIGINTLLATAVFLGWYLLSQVAGLQMADLLGFLTPE